MTYEIRGSTGVAKHTLGKTTQKILDRGSVYGVCPRCGNDTNLNEVSAVVDMEKTKVVGVNVSGIDGPHQCTKCGAKVPVMQDRSVVEILQRKEPTIYTFKNKDRLGLRKLKVPLGLRKTGQSSESGLPEQQ